MIVQINYTNWKGKTSDRLILPHKIWFGITEWHPTYQWLLRAEDLTKHEDRDFALADIHSWEHIEASLIPGNMTA